MDYGKISPQAVPHITTVTQYFSVAYEDYERTLGI